MQNQYFRNRYINRSADLMNSIFHPTHLNALVTQFEQERINEMPLHLTRWGSAMSAWQNNIQSMRNFCDNRSDFVRDHIKDEFGLTAEREIRLNVFPISGGSIEINTIKPDTFPWRGIYFQDVPISIKAVPRPGYRFSYWQTDVGLQNYPAEFSVDLQHDAYATAYFVHDICFDTLLVVDEINYSSSDTYNTDDWFEIYNKATASMLLSYWYIKDDNDIHIFTFPHDCWIAADEYLVVCRDTASFKIINPGINNYIGNFDFGLGSDNDRIRLFDSNGKSIFNVLYSNQFPWPENMENSSKTIELIDVNADVNIGLNWFAGCDGGSPGEVYQPCDTTFVENMTVENFYIFPNPFNAITTLYFKSEKQQDVYIKIYNPIGILISEMNYNCFPNNRYEIPIDLSAFPKGIYLCEIKGEGLRKAFKLISK
jgi:hypothetical protein